MSERRHVYLVLWFRWAITNSTSKQNDIFYVCPPTLFIFYACSMSQFVKIQMGHRMHVIFFINQICVMFWFCFLLYKKNDRSKNKEIKKRNIINSWTLHKTAVIWILIWHSAILYLKIPNAANSKENCKRTNGQ